MPWIHSAGHYDKMRPKIIAAAADLTAAGVDNQGLVGFCWGAKICHQAQVRPHQTTKTSRSTNGTNSNSNDAVKSCCLNLRSSVSSFILTF